MATSSTPGARSRQQESTPLSTSEKPPLTRDSSVIQQVSNFIGISGRENDEKEKDKWDKKRLRRIANKYSLNENEVQKFVRNRSINQGSAGPAFQTSVDSVTTPGGFPVSGSIEDIERGVTPARVFRTPAGRAPVGPTPSLPNYESTSTSFEGGRTRADSFSQTGDLSASQSRLSRASHQRESVPASVINSVTTFFKKGSFINKNRLKLRSSMASKCSFDTDIISTSQMDTPDDTTPSGSGKDETSPAGIIFSATGPSGGESFEMKAIPKRDRPTSGGSPRLGAPLAEAEAHLITSEIPEETSFEVEMEEMADVDEAQGVEMASDPTAIPRMTAKVRKKSSVRIPPHSRDLAEMSHLTTRSSPAVPLVRGKSMAPERPSDLKEGTRPFIHPSTSLPTQRSIQKKKKKSSQEDQVLDSLIEESEQKDREEGKEVPYRSFRSRSTRPHPPMLAERSISLVDEVFFDTPHPRLLLPGTSQTQGPAGAPPPELDSYHPDLGRSPPTSAKLPGSSYHTPSAYQFDPTTISLAEDSGVVRYHQDGNITYIDLGDSTLVRPKPVALGKTDQATSAKPDRPFLEKPGDASTSSRRILIRQSTIEEYEDNPSLLADLPHVRQYLDRRKQKEDITSKFARKIVTGKQSKRQRGIGVFGKFFGTSYKGDLSQDLKRILSDGVDERAWFTYWTTSVQAIVCILSIVMYGIGPYGFGMRNLKDDVMDTTLSTRRVSYMEPENMWLGPHYSDLIRLGALYSPCMRREAAMWTAIEEERRIENRTGCCMANDHSGCYQSSELICPRNVARWVRWDKPDPIASKKNFLTHKSKSESDLLRGLQNISSLLSSTKLWKQQRKSGAVCGQDPSYCDSPLSVAPHEWPDDITQWPICEKKHEGAGLPEHVTCPVTGRPCCIQLQGLCRIATKQYCDFVRGHWHENATLCSQVNCFSGVCGMLPFFGTYPDQFYRLFISLFIHAGVFHLLITIVFQFWAMRDLERLIGSKRMAILYLVSGIGGNIASAIFVPYNPEVGPSGSQCGILAAAIVDCYHHRRFIRDFPVALRQLIIVFFIVMAVGLVPWVDNWAHLFGFLFGLLTTIIIFPYLDFPDDTPPAPATVSTVPSTPLPRGTTPLRETPLETPKAPANSGSSGYSQLANGYPSPIADPENTMFQPMGMVWRIASRRFVNRRTFYVLIAAILLVSLFLILCITFFANIHINCPQCIYLNCVPPFPCHNQGQLLKKWLPI